jgi:hypothetical protein
MKKLSIVLLSFLFIGITSINAQTKTEETEQSLEDIFWKSKRSLLNTCTDSTIDRMEKDLMMLGIWEELGKKHDISYKNIAKCGCKKLIKKYPEADYKEIDSFGDLEGMQLVRECSSDKFVWDIFEGIFSLMGGEKFSTCIIESLRNNVSLDEFDKDTEYYIDMYAAECKELFKDRESIIEE